MRRFEFVEGTSAKFWSPAVEGNTFVVVFGRLGTSGQKKEKAFPTADAAKKEYDKKVAEKLREGYHEVASEGADASASEAKGAAAAAAPLRLPPRLRGHPPTPDQIARASAAVAALDAALGSRSWVVGRAARKAARALRAASGGDGGGPALQASVDALMVKVAGTDPSKRLPLRHALALLGQREASAFVKAAARTWKDIAPNHPAADAVGVLSQQLEFLGDEELALRVGRALVGSPTSTKGWADLAPHLEAYLARQHSSLRAHLTGLAGSHPALAARTRTLLGS